VKVYFDLCVYNRPFDDQKQSRIAIETLEFVFLLSKAEKGEISVINSFALEDENSQNPFVDRKDIISDLLKEAAIYVDYDEDLEEKAKEIEKLGIMGIDALHIACAEKAKSDFFVTCDDTLIKKCRAAKQVIKLKAMPLMKFIAEEVFKQ
jgi:predicted nucleic acid-binding protein